MANDQVFTRLAPIMHAYLEDLRKLGTYGKTKSDIVKRFIENGVQEALVDKAIEPRNISEFNGSDKDF